MADARSSEQDFTEVHNKIRRGDIIGVKGKPGYCIYMYDYESLHNSSHRNRVERVQKRRSEKNGNKETTFLQGFVAYVEKLK